MAEMYADLLLCTDEISFYRWNFKWYLPAPILFNEPGTGDLLCKYLIQSGSSYWGIAPESLP
jgi:hypothetical protein